MSSHSDRPDGPSSPEQSDGPETSIESNDATAEADTTGGASRFASGETSRGLRRQVREATLTAELDAVNEERDALDAEVEDLEADLAALESTVGELEATLERKTGELRETRRHYERLVDERERANQRLREERDRYARESGPLARGRVRLVTAVHRLVERLRG